MFWFNTCFVYVKIEKKTIKKNLKIEYNKNESV
jgi:hypothetical protein